MLLQLREWISREGPVSTQQLSRVFHIDEAALEPMLALWLAKGAIERCHASSSCQNKCTRCKPNTPVYYQIKS